MLPEKLHRLCGYRKNGQILARMNGPLTPVAPEGDTVRCKVKVDFGWNREEQYVHWQGKLSVDKGRILSVTPCFRGAAFTSPQEGETEFHTHVNRIVSARRKRNRTGYVQQQESEYDYRCHASCHPRSRDAERRKSDC